MRTKGKLSHPPALRHAPLAGHLLCYGTAQKTAILSFYPIMGCCVGSLIVGNPQIGGSSAESNTQYRSTTNIQRRAWIESCRLEENRSRMSKTGRAEEQYRNVLLPRAAKYDPKLHANNSEKNFVQIIGRWRTSGRVRKTIRECISPRKSKC
jgi:hypothetical protein